MSTATHRCAMLDVDYYVAVMDDPIILVSDIHANFSDGKMALMTRLTAELGASSLVVLGDLFDDMHRAVTIDELSRALMTIFRRKTVKDVYYVTSLSSHDPILNRDLHMYLDNSRIHSYPGALIAQVGRTKAFLTHGDIIMRNGAHAFMINLLARAFGRTLYLERKLRKLLRLPDDWWLFMGHTHLPGLDPASKIGNTGSWRNTWMPGVPYWRPPSRTMIYLEGNEVRLLHVRGRVRNIKGVLDTRAR